MRSRWAAPSREGGSWMSETATTQCTRRTESGTAARSPRSGARGAERGAADEVTLGRAFEGRRLLDV
ncbi:hypothetical protein [Streptomyces sp. A3M-1-3]|uniref:hypothetical protein n=1 Tax=Streptomyces sp. A3M-1-3 TaxID=2962044 RepID=UPI0035ABF95A